MGIFNQAWAIYNFYEIKSPPAIKVCGACSVKHLNNILAYSKFELSFIFVFSDKYLNRI